ncbi:MAG TPA: pilus assembly protein [Rhodoblastus sp.]|nr:pilus assembly protein [Rhodoblastus sp.]
MAEPSHAAGQARAQRRWLRILPARWRDDRGVAAVEFAIILPVMLGLYLSTAITTKAYMATRKVALVARALADIASRQTAATGNPTVSDTDMSNFFAAAATIMAPYSSTSLKMTLSRIDVIKDSSGNLWAFTNWSVINNGGVARPCNGTNASFNRSLATWATNSSTYPLLADDKSVTTANYQKYLPPEYTQASAPTGYLIVADVAYTYSPGFSFRIFNWSNLTSINTGWTQAFWSRTGLPIIGSSLSSNATVCTQNNPSNRTS